MSYIVFTYDDLEEQLDNLTNAIVNVDEILHYEVETNINYFEWKNGNYEDVTADLWVKLPEIRKNLVSIIKRWNEYLEDAKNADSDFAHVFDDRYKINIVEGKK